MSKVIPSLRFNDGRCREAMAFYKDCLGGGELNFMTAKGTPMESDMPADKLDLVMHSTLIKGDLKIIGSDMIMDKATYGDGVGVMLECDSEDEIRSVFAKLSEGGEVFAPLEDMFWGAIYGMVTDKYGVEWSLNFQKVPLA